MRWTFFPLAVALGLVPARAGADVVHFADGGRIEGVARRVGSDVVVRVDGGELRFSGDLVLRIERTEDPLSVLARRAARLPEGSVAARVQLARWAEAAGLIAEARGLWREVIALDPDHEEARTALGHEKIDGRWMTERQARVAKGMVRYGGQWITAEAAREEQEQLEAQEEARERARAEARAQGLVRAAEAAADEARAAAAQCEEGARWGLATPWVFGGFPLPATRQRSMPAPFGSVGLGIRVRRGAPGGQVVFPPLPASGRAPPPPVPGPRP